MSAKSGKAGRKRPARGAYRPPAPAWKPTGEMRRTTSSSMRQLASQVQKDHPEMGMHVHIRDAANALDRGNTEAAARHLGAAIGNATPQSLRRHGIMTDEDYHQAKAHMDNVHRHLLLVKEIQDHEAHNANLTAISRMATEDASDGPDKADPSAAYGPGRNAAVPYTREPAAMRPGERPNSGGADKAAAQPKTVTSWHVTKQVAASNRLTAVELAAAGYPCPECSTRNAPDASFCKRCAHAVKPAVPYDHYASEDVTCPNCGRGDDADAVFCDQCGKRLPAGLSGHDPAVELGFRFNPLEKRDKHGQWTRADAGEAISQLRGARQSALARYSKNRTLGGWPSQDFFDAHASAERDIKAGNWHRAAGHAEAMASVLERTPVDYMTSKRKYPSDEASRLREVASRLRGAAVADPAYTRQLERQNERLRRAHPDPLDKLAMQFSAETGRLAVTPAPRGKPGGPGLYRVKGNEHSPYMQQVVKALIEKRGMPPGKAYAIAWGALRRWRRGGGNVHPEVRAAAAGALGQEDVARARAHSHANGGNVHFDLAGDRPYRYRHGWIKIGPGGDVSSGDKVRDEGGGFHTVHRDGVRIGSVFTLDGGKRFGSQEPSSTGGGYKDDHATFEDAVNHLYDRAPGGHVDTSGMSPSQRAAWRQGRAGGGQGYGYGLGNLDEASRAIELAVLGVSVIELRGPKGWSHNFKREGDPGWDPTPHGSRANPSWGKTGHYEHGKFTQTQAERSRALFGPGGKPRMDAFPNATGKKGGFAPGSKEHAAHLRNLAGQADRRALANGKSESEVGTRLRNAAKRIEQGNFTAAKVHMKGLTEAERREHFAGIGPGSTGLHHAVGEARDSVHRLPDKGMAMRPPEAMSADEIARTKAAQAYARRTAGGGGGRPIHQVAPRGSSGGFATSAENRARIARNRRRNAGLSNSEYQRLLALANGGGSPKG